MSLLAEQPNNSLACHTKSGAMQWWTVYVSITLHPNLKLAADVLLSTVDDELLLSRICGHNV